LSSSLAIAIAAAAVTIAIAVVIAFVALVPLAVTSSPSSPSSPSPSRHRKGDRSIAIAGSRQVEPVVMQKGLEKIRAGEWVRMEDP
jgi:ABC-type phosphate transport system substrate-binding protein